MNRLASKGKHEKSPPGHPWSLFRFPQPPSLSLPLSTLTFFFKSPFQASHTLGMHLPYPALPRLNEHISEFSEKKPNCLLRTSCGFLAGLSRLTDCFVLLQWDGVATLDVPAIIPFPCLLLSLCRN